MTTKKRILKIPLRASIILLLLGMLAKIFALPIAKWVILFGFVALGVLYALRFTEKSDKGYIDYIKLCLVLFWTTNGVLRILDFPNTLFFQIMTALFFVFWFITEGTAYFMDDDRKSRNTLAHILWNCTMVVGALAVIGGSLLKILDVPYALPLLGIGIALITAYILKDFFVSRKISEDKGSNEEFQL